MPCDLIYKKVALVIGHEPGGGAKGEREWNIKVSMILACKLEDRGAEVFIYQHETKAYSQRCREMREAVMDYLPNSHCVLLMHYNSFPKPSAHGHEFHFRGVKSFAAAIRDAWQKRYPWSRARQDNGILKNTSAHGSGMLKLAPSAACLTEPFFESNLSERNFLIDDHEGVASAYAEGIANYLLK